MDPNALIGASLTTSLPGFDAQNRLDLQNDNAYFVLGFLDTPTDIDTATNAVLTAFAQDPTNAVNVAGGGSSTVGPGGVTASTVDYRVHVFNQGGEDIGIYTQLNDGAMLTVMFARPSVFAAQMQLAQSGVLVDGAGVFAGANGEGAASAMMNRPGEAPPIAADTSAAPASADAGGSYLIPTGNLEVAWPAGWSVVGQDDVSIELTNASQTMNLYIAGIPFNGATWDQEAVRLQGQFFDDQGASATISGPVVTENGFMFTTDGQYGPRMANAFASSDPLVYVWVLAHTIQPGADLAALAAEANGVTANGVPVFQGIEAVIPAV